MADIVEDQSGKVKTIQDATESSHERAKAGLDQVKQAANNQGGCQIS